LTGGTSVSTNAANTPGYVTTRVIGVDQAGNQTAATTVTVVEDNIAPSVKNVDLPASVTGNSTQAFSASVSDNLDVVGSYAAIGYAGAGMTLQYPTTAGPGVAFDNVLTRSAVVTPTIPNFINNLQVNNGSAAVAAPVAGNNASSVQITAVDEVGLKNTLSANLSPSVSFTPGASSSFSTSTFNAGFVIVTTNGTLSDCPTAGCAGGAQTANPTSTQIIATAQGTTGTFNNPFAGGAVEIFYQVNGAGNWFLAGNASAGSSRDNGVNRFWDYSFTFTPPKTAPDGTALTAGATIAVRAVGVNTAGDAVAGPAVNITLTNP